MPVLAMRDRHATWYSAVPGYGNRDIVTEAYHDAVELLKAEIRIDSDSPVPIENLASIEDVYAIVEKAKQKYMDTSAKHTGARQWLEKLSGRIMHYAPVLDVLAQHHPEYVTLAWGAIKFVLMGIINRATLVEELSKALVTIGDVLPRAHLSVELYQTVDMKAALSRLYTCLIMFLHLCVRWYNQSSWGRLWSSLKNPFELKYKNLISDIELCSTLVEGLANGGARVEIRAIHALSELDHSKLIEIDAKVDNVYNAQTNQLKEINTSVVKLSDRQTKLEAQMIQMIQIATSSKWTIEQMSGDIRSTSQSVYRLEFQHVVRSFMPTVLPDAALLKIQSLARSSPMPSLPTRDKLKVERMLRDWASSKYASFLVLQAGLCAQKQATELAADVVKHLRANNQCVFWNISSGPWSKHVTTITDVFKTIIFQALQHSRDLFMEFGEQLNLSKTQGFHTEREWVDLICLLLTKLPRAFVVIETQDIHKMYRHDQNWVDRFLGLLRFILDRTTASGCQLKILLIMYGDKTRTAANSSKDKNMLVASLQPSTPIPPRLRRLVGQHSLNTKGWNLQKPER